MFDSIKKALGKGKDNTFRVSHRLKGRKRLPGEAHKDYKYRRAYEDALLKEYMKGEVLWKGKTLVEHQMMGADGQPITIHSISSKESQGTYVKKKHGILRSYRSK